MNINKVKDGIQKEATKSVIEVGGRALVTMATGAGKSRVPLLYLKKKDYQRIALIVPTEKLRDSNWLQEYQKWDMENYWSKTERLCYASASKISNKTFDLVILDEAHNITELSFEFFRNNNIKDIIALTATPPVEKEKLFLFNKLDLKHSYDLPIDEAVELGVVSPYEIHVVFTELDKVSKNIKAGNSKVVFYQTEAAAYKYMTDTLAKDDCFGKKREMLIFKRLRFLYDLPSKTAVAKRIIESLPENERTLIFCGSIAQSEQLSDYQYHSKSKDTHLDLFMNEEINELSCVKALNEGINISNLDNGVVVSFDSKEKNIVQRIGRIIRYRKGHRGKIIIVCCKDTQDEVWLSKCLAGFDEANITYYNSLNSYLLCQK